ncbi:hypothetical protein B0H13DRAFT_1981952 [Mycena leptocephala]|nr:hypothetical protein B0H13DRAFT_1981952 [Mycena leptocephala]
MFNFPRFSVVQGYEHTAFIPYDGVAKSAPAGLVTRIQDTVVGLTATNVLLASGRKVDYEYLSLPVQVESTEFVPACKELQSIAVVGAGAVGVELATDIKSFYPEKDVTLIHSRGQILNTFGKRLHDHVLPVLRDELDIRVLLNERPQLPRDRALLKATTLTFSDGHEEPFDLTIACTGQRPNSSFLATLLPDAISQETSRILVKPTLQLSLASDPNPRIFAFGDVAEHGGPRMGRAALMQSHTVLHNILSMIYGQPPSATYTPQLVIEAALKLTLGRERLGVDLGIKRAWSMLGVDFKRARAAAELLANSSAAGIS